jgi:hypothetical protein
MSAKIKTDFEISYNTTDGKHFLTISPSVKNEGFKPKEIEVTEEQWNALRYHFAVGYPSGKDKFPATLSYIV